MLSTKLKYDKMTFWTNKDRPSLDILLCVFSSVENIHIDCSLMTYDSRLIDFATVPTPQIYGQYCAASGRTIVLPRVYDSFLPNELSKW